MFDVWSGKNLPYEQSHVEKTQGAKYVQSLS